jgi:hypothetical protein
VFQKRFAKPVVALAKTLTLREREKRDIGKERDRERVELQYDRFF